jgi:hypothetical protein
MTTVTAQANPNIAFIKFTLAKLGRTNRAGSYREGISPAEVPFSGIIQTNQMYETQSGAGLPVRERVHEWTPLPP